MQRNAVTLSTAHADTDWIDVRTLFRHYAEWLNVDLCFQDFADELESLPGCYAGPGGCVLLARLDAQPVGCVGLRPLANHICEMKRLWVEPAYQGHGLGRRLAEAIISAGRELGYHSMRLDTLPQRLTVAQQLYQSLGFRKIPAYYPNPLEGAEMFELRYGEGHLAKPDDATPSSAIARVPRPRESR